MGFQIVDKDNNPIKINQLDGEAAMLWDKEMHPKKYANPFKDYRLGHGNNWFDVIGFQISSIKYIERNIRFPLEVIKIELAKIFNHKVESPEFVKPFYDLINYWVDKGYQARKV